MIQTLLINGITGLAQPDDIHSCSEEKAGAAVEPSRPTSQLQVGQFQDLRDTHHLIKSKSGMFWCYTHLQDLPVEKQSPDPRYCQKCFEVLSQEAKDTGIRHSRKAPLVATSH